MAAKPCCTHASLHRHLWGHPLYSTCLKCYRPHSSHTPHVHTPTAAHSTVLNTPNTHTASSLSIPHSLLTTHTQLTGRKDHIIHTSHQKVTQLTHPHFTPHSHTCQLAPHLRPLSPACNPFLSRIAGAATTQTHDTQTPALRS